MGKNDKRLISLFTVVMLLFCAFMVWYVPKRADMDFQLTDVARSLETSRGRERKQQAEYDQVVEDLPKVQEEWEQTQPLADAASAEVDALKAERKRLREEKQALEDALQEEASSVLSTNEEGKQP